MQSQPPSHPELLDWLAVEFMDQAWSIKQLHRLIVTSATYRQSSHVSAELLSKDPYNRLLARGPRFRVDAELVRDIALAASGLLQPEVGGPSVYPPIPSFLLRPPASYGDKAWPVSMGADRYRRAMYTFRFRTLPYPILQTFDAPSGEVACIRRPRSNTPLQALMTLNEPMSVECARALANRVWKEAGPDPVAQVTHLFRLCLSRAPSASELERLLTFLDRQQQRLKSKELDSASLLGPDLIASLPDEQACDELAGLASVARVILNLDETISKE
jgi:hypothetical protein